MTLKFVWLIEETCCYYHMTKKTKQAIETYDSELEFIIDT